MGFQNGIKPKRSLGQNFFNNEKLIKKIIKIVLESHPKHITEIGAGKGSFTKEFYDFTIDLTLIEKDFTLAQILQNNFNETEIYNIDFLDYELKNPNTTYFGSLPFNISKDIIDKVIKSYTFSNPAFFIIQKEVADKYSNNINNSLGLIREIYADFQHIFNIKPGNYTPRPNVETSFIKLIPHERFLDINKEALEKLIQRSFKTPRKTLNNNLKIYNYNLSKEIGSKRAAELSLKDYMSILESS
jgi:16S rRNA (adenine1518-N6/adenine1519-N6)-dimethyltransferase